MSKLFKLKEWLTLADTAKHLSNILEEEVTEADVGLSENSKKADKREEFSNVALENCKISESFT